MSSNYVLFHLLDLVEAGHGDIGLFLLVDSNLHPVYCAAIFRLRCVRSILQLQDVQWGWVDAQETVFVFKGAPDQQGRDRQLLCAVAGGAAAV